MTKTTMVLAVCCLLVGTASADDFYYKTPSDYSHRGVTVSAKEVRLDHHNLKFRLMVMNGTGKFMHLEKGAFRVKLAAGRVVESSALGKHDLYPGQAHALDLNFHVGRGPQTTSLVMSGVTVDGKPYPLPDYVVTPFPARRDETVTQAAP